ncbi:tyrosine-type recombinase/integrase (plasmid) [Cupriavidus metallidurans]|uniref:hypothetical protein n=1 Tax=Cupriavidus metallidurans TaxID=119219 RepID=UPI003D75F138
MANKEIFEPKTVDWQNDPTQAFDGWLSTLKGRRKDAPQLKVSSVEIYKLQWGKFLAFLDQRKILVTETTAKDVSDFLSTLANTNASSQRERYRALLERVFKHLLGADATTDERLNPASCSSQGIEPGRKNLLNTALQMGFLRRSEYDILVSHLNSPLKPATDITAHRKQLRDRAMVAVFLGAGLKVHQALSLTVSCIETKRVVQITVQEEDSKFFHQVRVMPFAADLLKRWLAQRRKWERECLKKGRKVGDLVFPAEIVDPDRLQALEEDSPDAKPSAGSWIDLLDTEGAAGISRRGRNGTGTRLVGRAMNSVMALRVCEAVMQESGVYTSQEGAAAESISPQILRNSFAAALFASGETTLGVQHQLGFAEEISAARVKAAWDSWRSFGND